MESGTLVKVRSNHDNLRTSKINGRYFSLPSVGESFCLVGESLMFNGGSRIVATTPVTKIVMDDKVCCRFWTENSEYLLLTSESNEGNNV